MIIYLYSFQNPLNVSCCVENKINFQKQHLKGVHVLIGYVAKLKFIMQIVVISFTKRYLMRLKKSAKRVVWYLFLRHAEIYLLQKLYLLCLSFLSVDRQRQCGYIFQLIYIDLIMMEIFVNFIKQNLLAS